MKKVVIIGVILLLLLVGGGGAAWWFLLREPPEEAMAESEQAPPDMVFVDFDPMVVSVLRDGHATDHLTFMIILQVADAERRSLVYRQTPRLRDAFRTELHSILSRSFIQDRDDTMPILSKRLKEVCERLLGKGEVLQVLINIMTRREFQQQEAERPQ